MVLVKIMTPGKGHDEQRMSKGDLLELICKMYKKNYFVVNAETNEVIRDINTIGENDAITIMPVVAGG